MKPVSGKARKQRVHESGLSVVKGASAGGQTAMLDARGHRPLLLKKGPKKAGEPAAARKIASQTVLAFPEEGTASRDQKRAIARGFGVEAREDKVQAATQEQYPVSDWREEMARLRDATETRKLRAWTQKWPLRLKRALDIAGSLAGLLVGSPLLLAVAAGVKLSSPGPVLFRQKRVGQYGKEFTFLKFRSMKHGNDPTVHEKFVAKLLAEERDAEPRDAAAGETRVYKLVDDPRITRFGAFIRRTSLDELPQLLNVLAGEMSLVGPRPPIPYEVEKYAPWHLERLVVAKPGITGLWQVEGRSRVSFNEMVRMDLRYAKEWSLWLDIQLLVRTIGVVCKMTGAR